MESKIFFKKSNKKQFRKRKSSSENESGEEDETNFRDKLEETKEVQKLRKRNHGVSVSTLAEGVKQNSVAPEKTSSDPFKMKTGGMIDLKTLKLKKAMMKDPELDAVDLGNTFSAETNARDEDADMVKYIEAELAKRKGIEEPSKDSEHNTMTDDVLYQVSEHLRSSTTKRSEEMLSNQMLSGIPEVDLGVDVKMKNIEATEEAKKKRIQECMNRKESSMSFVPTNMATNFVRFNRFNLDDPEQHKSKKPKLPEVKPEPVAVVGDNFQPVIKIKLPGMLPLLTNQKETSKKPVRATDDFHFEKFKKQFRRH
ncbi:Telomere length and silencing protein 1 [Nymphon striatum]|nr:Telomere length and silencing protein 1 [Nymphon striatum]KAG1712125.1 Telomere length and silencing protein 1 [Nymphon striatum]